MENRFLVMHRDGLAWKEDKLYVPKDIHLMVLRRCHVVKPAGHFGFLKTLHLARHQFWWPRMRRDIEEVSGLCYNEATSREASRFVAVHSKPQEAVG